MNRRGFTLLEVLIVIGLVGVMAALGIPRIRRAIVRQNVRSARDAVVTMHAKARAVAIQRGSATALVFQANNVLIVSRHPVTGAPDTIGQPTDLHGRYGVTVNRTRDTLVFDSRGLGMETGNTKVTVAKNVFQDSVVINPWGRVLR
jgi:prepilin-type N-terminal cleavage/methylation domain-containing protein